MKNMGAQTVKAGCQSSGSGYYYAPRPWEVAGMKIKDDRSVRLPTPPAPFALNRAVSVAAVRGPGPAGPIQGPRPG